MHAPESYGSNPPEADSNGTLNASLPQEQRSVKGQGKLSAGPLIGEGGEYKPAKYKQTIVHPIHGEQTVLRTDR